MLGLSYTTNIRPILVGLAIFLVLLTVALTYHERTNSHLDACFINREVQAPGPTIIPIRDGPLHNFSVYVMWLSMFVLSILPHGRSKAIFSLTYSSIWFHSTYILLAALKAPLSDYNCAGRHKFYPNGISGHYCYFVFVSLTAARFAQARLKANQTPPIFLLSIAAFLMTLFSIGAIGTLYRTFFHGYHSVRQIFLGTSLGIFSHLGLDYTLYDNPIQYPPIRPLLTLFANSVSSLALYKHLWPHRAAGPAISAAQLVFHAGLWLVQLVNAFFFLPKIQLSKKHE